MQRFSVSSSTLKDCILVTKKKAHHYHNATSAQEKSKAKEDHIHFLIQFLIFFKNIIGRIYLKLIIDLPVCNCQKYLFFQ